ncbi:hypothetical protein JCM19000A_10210 [Silvimonas sp. JCM 19000]
MRASKFQKGQLILLAVVIVVGVGSMLLDVTGVGSKGGAGAPLSVGGQAVAARAGAYACAYADTARKTVELIAQGNQDKFETFFDSNECREIDRDLKLEVVALDGDFAQVRGPGTFFGRSGGVWVPPGMLHGVAARP